jgi:hypothetical protein
MTLESTLLEKLSEWRPYEGGRQELHVAAEGWAVCITAERSDALGCLLWEVTLQREGSAGVDLASWAAAAATRVAGLMEPLKVLEVDQVRQEAQLRSEGPLARGDKKYFYELLLKGNGLAVLRRFQCASGTAKRQQVTFALTHEVLAKLAQDVTASAGLS